MVTKCCSAVRWFAKIISLLKLYFKKLLLLFCRMHIVERIQYNTYISAALQSMKVLDHDDDEELKNYYLFRTNKMRTSMFNHCHKN